MRDHANVLICLIAYEEDEEGFQFSRVPSKKSRPSIEAVPEHPSDVENAHPKPTPKRGRPKKKQPDETSSVLAKGKSVELPSRRPTRANEAHAESESQSTKIPRSRNRDSPERQPEAKKSKKGRPPKARAEANGYNSPEHPSAVTKVALPVADTPVIQRNKELRGGKGEKGRRRSSLNMRGRRASSLIDSGASNGRSWSEVSC